MMTRRIVAILLALESLLGVAHLVWPEFRWGQGRGSYFNFDNSLTLASYLAAMQLIAAGVLALVAFHRDRDFERETGSRASWWWGVVAFGAFAVSLMETTRLHNRLRLLGLPRPDVYERLVLYPLLLAILVAFGWFFARKAESASLSSRPAFAWLGGWCLSLVVLNVRPLFPSRFQLVLSLAEGLGFLLGCTFLLQAHAEYALRPAAAQTPAARPRSAQRRLPRGVLPVPTLLGVGGTTFTLIFLQIVLFQLLTIFADYLTATSVISIALLGIAIGALIGFVVAPRAPMSGMIAASFVLPLCILASFGAVVIATGDSLLLSFLLMLPFVAGSAVISIALARAESHLVYCADLVGAALGAWAVAEAIWRFREESSLLFLLTASLVSASCFIVAHPNAIVRRRLLLLTGAGVLASGVVGTFNLRYDWLNVIRTEVGRRYPQAQLLYSRSSMIGRYDIARMAPGSGTLKSLENGRVID